MATKVLCISETGMQKLSSFRNSIKLLFDVDIRPLQDDYSQNCQCKGGATGHVQAAVEAEDCECLEAFDVNGNPNIPMQRILMETNGPPTNIANAQKYAIACFPSHLKYKVITVKLCNLQTFETVQRHSTSVQLSTLSALTFNPDLLELTIQGHESCVEHAERDVRMIIEDYLPKDSSNQLNTSSKCHTDAPFSSTLTESKEKLQAQSELETDGGSAIDNFQIGSHTLLNDLSSSADHVSLHQKSSASSSSTVESDDDNNVNNDPLTDSRNSKQVERAIRMGYSPCQIQVALNKLGPGCSSDDLLSELIKIGSEQSENRLSHDELVDHLINIPMKGISLAASSAVKLSPRRCSLELINPPDLDSTDNLRSIVIDGSNVAMSHGQDKFSCRGIKIAVDWFKKRGHTDITVFVPQWRKETSRADAPIEDQHILLELERERILTFTPSRRIQGRRVVSYDDRYILKHADDVDGIVVSRDEYRDLVKENEAFRKVVEQRLLPYTFVKDKFMPPDDPLGRLGPSLDDLLRKVPSEPAPKPQDCPYGKKCTYGNKCRYYHPERGFASQKSVTETLKEQANINLQEIASKKTDVWADKGRRQKQKLARTKSLVPGETLSDTLPSDAIESDGSCSSKTKLCHSKSLVSPTKTGDYLTASRLKLEAIESKEGPPSISKDCSRSFSPSEMESNIHVLGDSVSATHKVQKWRKGNTDVVRSHSPSPRTSPAPTSDFTIVSAPSKSSFTSPTFDSLAMPYSHLAVPNSQPQESYSSGHLSVAKKLSDEGSEKSFFAGRSAPSAFDEKDNATKTSTVNDYPSQDLLVSDEFFDAQKQMSRTADNQPNTYEDTSSLAYFQDSGIFSIYDSPQPRMSPQNFPPFPPVRKESSSHGRQNLHRSLSSSYSMKAPDNMYRRSSDVIGLKGNEHPQLRGQRSNPIHQQHYHRRVQASVPGILRQNSSSNPEICSWAENFDSGTGLDSVCAPYYSAPLPGAGDVDHSIHDPSQQHLPPSFQMSAHQPNIPYYGDQYLGCTHTRRVPMAKPGVTMPGDRVYPLPSYPPFGHPGRGADHGFQYQYDPNAQGPLVPPHQPLFFPYSVQQPHSPAPYSPDLMSPHSPFQGQPMYQGQQSYGHYEVPNQYQFSRPKANVTAYEHDYQQSSQSIPANNPVAPVDQDAPIHPNDSRYATYYNLSTVYGEKVVRNFMNRNPDVKDLQQLINLISAYIVESGS